MHYEYGPGGDERRCGGRAWSGRGGFRGFRGFGPGGGGGSGWAGDVFRAGKMFADGDLRLIVLALLESEPRHGYDIIKSLEERSRGVYSPSPGVVYPTLTFLEEAGYVSSSSQGNRKVYTITDAGRAHLEENRAVAEMALRGMEKFGEKMARARTWWEGNNPDAGPEQDRDIPGASDELNAARRELKAAIAEKRHGASDEQRRVAGILRDAAAALRGETPKTDKDPDAQPSA